MRADIVGLRAYLDGDDFVHADNIGGGDGGGRGE